VRARARAGLTSLTLLEYSGPMWVWGVAPASTATYSAAASSHLPSADSGSADSGSAANFARFGGAAVQGSSADGSASALASAMASGGGGGGGRGGAATAVPSVAAGAGIASGSAAGGGRFVPLSALRLLRLLDLSGALRGCGTSRVRCGARDFALRARSGVPRSPLASVTPAHHPDLLRTRNP
jgi:hypothetical protein